MYSVSGKVFHVDFGYILGRDPKPMPPPMKLSKEMVEAMGGTGSEQFTGMIQYFKQSWLLFCRFCYVFSILKLIGICHLQFSKNLILVAEIYWPAVHPHCIFIFHLSVWPLFVAIKSPVCHFGN